MYKCSECGQEYNTKPEYCDCGNNEFIEVVQEVVEEEVVVEEKKQDTHYEEQTQTIIQEQQLKKKTTEKQDIASIIIFITCIILSVLSLIFIGNTPNKKVEQKIDKNKTIIEKNENKQIPSIEELWNNSTPKTKEETKIEPQPQVEKQEIQKPVTQPNTPNIQAQPVKKKIKQQPKNQINPQPKPQQDPAKAKRDLLNYKISLRNKIASKINFAAIVGDGSCVITFKVSPKGDLTGRSFAKLSENETLNDAVYAAMMYTPSFNPPPSAYKNETLRLSVKMYDGNFEVDLN